jgi:hypothetical protein
VLQLVTGSDLQSRFEYACIVSLACLRLETVRVVPMEVEVVYVVVVVDVSMERATHIPRLSEGQI